MVNRYEFLLEELRKTLYHANVCKERGNNKKLADKIIEARKLKSQIENFGIRNKICIAEVEFIPETGKKKAIYYFTGCETFEIESLVRRKLGKGISSLMVYEVKPGLNK